MIIYQDLHDLNILVFRKWRRKQEGSNRRQFTSSEGEKEGGRSYDRCCSCLVFRSLAAKPSYTVIPLPGRPSFLQTPSRKMIRLPHFCLRSYKLLAQVAPLSALVIVELWFTSFGCTEMGQRIVVTIMSFFCFLNPKPKDREAVLMFGFGRLHLILPWGPFGGFQWLILILTNFWNRDEIIERMCNTSCSGIPDISVYVNFWVYRNIR